MRKIYLDNASTTCPLKEVIFCINAAMIDYFGNASSLHEIGIKSERILRCARKKIMKFIGANEGDLYFTSGGTESNNMAIFGSLKKNHGKIITSAIEHASVLNPIRQLGAKGFEIDIIYPDSFGNIQYGELESRINENTLLVSIMLINNEIGTINKIKEFSNIISKKSNAVFHVDAVQAFGKIPISVQNMGIDLMTMSAHKIHGPKGIGALYVSKKIKIKPMFFGGSQEKEIRPGTEAVPLVAGFLKAIELCDINKNYEKIEKINDYCRECLKKIKGVKINSPADASPFILNFSIPGIKSEIILNFLSERGIFISSASACSGNDRSHVLTAMNLDITQVDSALRVSFSRFNSRQDIDTLIANIKKALNDLIF
ncbi:MAG: cysteine desulfurase [Oscillospiraceae bacterium]|nr:cysteine desulfurase [Oscillospiraceae bacterium]